MGNEKMTFEEPAVEILTFQKEDIITTSSGLERRGFFGDEMSLKNRRASAAPRN